MKHRTAPGIPRRPRRDRAPLSLAQEAILRAESVRPGTALHNETAAFRLAGQVDAAILERALTALSTRHEVLRCGIETRDGDGPAWQVFAERVRPGVATVDLSALPEAERAARLHRDLARCSRIPFDLARPPLLRTYLFRLGPERHVLLFVAHHIVVDAWAFGVFLDSLAEQYAIAAGASGEAFRAVQPVIDFGDYAAWQRHSADLGQGLDYWRERLAGNLPVARLPLAGPRQEPGNVAGEVHHLTLPRGLVDRLRALARAELATLPTVLLSAYCAVVLRYTGQDELMVGMPVATRNLPRLASVIGPMFNLMVYRADFSGEPGTLTFRDVLRRTRASLKRDLAYRGVPLDVLAVEHGRSPSSFFQVMYAFHSGPATTLRLPGTEVMPLPAHSGTAKYDLSIFLRPRPSGEVDMTLEYRIGVLGAETVAELGEGLRCLLEAVAAEADLPLSDLPVMSPRQLRRVLGEFNRVDRGRPGWASVADAVRARARELGEAPAVRDAGTVLGYGWIDAGADRVAARLGAAPGDRVAVRVRRRAELVPLVLGIWRAGAVLVPVDETLPAARAEYLVRDSGARLLVSDWPLADLPVVALDRLLADTPPGPDEASPAAQVTGEDLAYLMYTSGSTGQPKGVAVPHRCMANLLHSVVRKPGIGRDDVLLAVSSLGFDISMLELFAPLVAGAQVVVAPGEVVRDVEELGRLIERSGATLMQATPSLWRALVDGGWAGRAGLRALSGGEPLDPGLADRLLTRTAELWNLYGPTETTIWSTAGRVLPGEPVTVGRPVANTYCHILDRAGRTVPRGAVGELVIGGAGVAAGYWGRPDLTARAFTVDPFDRARGMVYRTGDLAQYLPDGRIRILGRSDQQVKVLGHRIELGEVEDVLASHPDVRHAAVVLNGGPGGARLVAFVALWREVSGSELRRYLVGRLPVAAVPALVVPVPDLPLNASGKVDRTALAQRADGLTAPDGPDARDVPATAAERAVARIWAAVLGVPADGVGRGDDFLAAGGNSLTVTQLLSRVRAAVGGAPSLAEFYAKPVLAELAAAAGRSAARPGTGAARALGRTAADSAPLTVQQRQLWLLDRLDEGGGAYHLSARIEFDAPLDPVALAGALRDLVRRHEVLAARCELRAGWPVMVFEPPAEVPLDVVDLADLADPDPAGRERHMAELAREQALRPFDLAVGPLLRAVLLRTGRSDTLLVTAHHIAIDGWSIGVAARDLAACYAARTGTAAAPAALTLRFRDYAAAEAAPAAVTAHAECLAYWTRRLDGYPGILELPADLGHRAHRSSAGRTLPVSMPAGTAAALRQAATRLRTTPFAVLLAVFAHLLGRYAGTDDVVVGVPVAGRDRPELEDLVGCLTTTLPVRVDLSGRPPLAELATRVGQVLAEDLDRSRLPFDRLVSELGIPRDPARSPLVQAMFVFQTIPARISLDDTRGQLVPVDTGSAKYDLTLFLDDRLGGGLEFAAERFSPELSARIVGHLRVLLTAALARPEEPLDGVELAGPGLPSPNPAEPFGAQRRAHAVPVHELFRRHAAASPDAEAVRCGDQRLTYRDLDRWSDLIALRLRAAGAMRGRFVAVLVPTGAVQVAALLGVAKSGAAFACLDPADPQLRLETVLRDAEPVCLLAGEQAATAHPDLLDRAEGRFAGVPVQPAAEPPKGNPVDTAQSGAGASCEPDDPLCLVYTSGSTGVPKGIALPHASFAQFAAWQREHFGIGPGSRVAQWAPFTYDAAYTEVFGALCAGATICIPPDGVRRDPVATARWLHAERITQLQTVPAFWQLITEALAAGAHRLPNLEHLLLAGEVLPPSLAAAWAGRPDRPRIHNLYGPTECILATHRELAPDEEFPAGVPIGVPISGREALVLDVAGRLCPVGAVGEIHLRSDFLAGGYHRRPEESARAYPEDPWRPGGTLYRTGDLGRRLPNGELAFVGRLDSQVKIRGHRVELAEIEALLEQHPDVRDAAAVVHDTAEGRRITGYAVPAKGAGQAVSGPALRAYLADRLPSVAVPDTVLLLDELPRTRSNKRDRGRLPPRQPTATAGEAEAAAPRRGVEQLVAEAWCLVLGRERVGRHTNFFEAGGDSLLAARLQIELCRRLDRDIRLVEIFIRPTVAEFAAGLDAGAGTGPGIGRAPDAAGRAALRRSATQQLARMRRTVTENRVAAGQPEPGEEGPHGRSGC